MRSCWYGSDLGSEIMGLLPHRTWFPPSCEAGCEPVYGTRLPCGLFLSARNPVIRTELPVPTSLGLRVLSEAGERVIQVARGVPSEPRAAGITVQAACYDRLNKLVFA